MHNGDQKGKFIDGRIVQYVGNTIVAEIESKEPSRCDREAKVILLDQGI